MPSCVVHYIGLMILPCIPLCMNSIRYINKYTTAKLLLRKFSALSINTVLMLWFDCTKATLTKLKVAYNNSLRRFMDFPWHNSASEMFVNLNTNSFNEVSRVFVHGF